MISSIDPGLQAMGRMLEHYAEMTGDALQKSSTSACMLYVLKTHET